MPKRRYPPYYDVVTDMRRDEVGRKYARCSIAGLA
jgi:hypothetical protein